MLNNRTSYTINENYFVSHPPNKHTYLISLKSIAKWRTFLFWCAAWGDGFENLLTGAIPLSHYYATSCCNDSATWGSPTTEGCKGGESNLCESFWPAVRNTTRFPEPADTPQSDDAIQWQSDCIHQAKKSFPSKMQSPTMTSIVFVTLDPLWAKTSLSKCMCMTKHDFKGT